MNERYGNMLRFLRNEFVNLKFVNKNAEELINLLGYLNVLITALPLILNLAWWTNSVTLIYVISTKWISDGLSSNHTPNPCH
jgi:hypothetical protein